MTVVWQQQAVVDLESIVAYLLERHPQAAIDVSDAIRQQVRRLGEGRCWASWARRQHAGTPHEGLPYIVPYYRKGREVRILAVLHTSRRWPDEFDLV